MKLFSLVSPDNYFVKRSQMRNALTVETEFRSVGIIGTWKEFPCPGGGDAHFKLEPPLVVDLESDEREFAEIVWGYGSYDFICTTFARHIFEDIGEHFRFEDVRIQFGRFKQRGNPTYEAIREKKFFWPIPRKTISIDPVENGLMEEILCDRCGMKKYKFKIENLKIRQSQVLKVDAFCIKEIGQYSPIFVTGEYKEALLRAGLTNIAFFEAGKFV